jgi:hypothetical protein
MPHLRKHSIRKMRHSGEAHSLQSQEMEIRRIMARNFSASPEKKLLRPILTNKKLKIEAHTYQTSY